jgi:hypothetical protein
MRRIARLERILDCFLVGMLGLGFSAFSEGLRARALPAEEPTKARDEASPITDLFMTEEIMFPTPPPVDMEPPMQCDLNGNIYVVYGDRAPSTRGELLLRKLSPESKSVTAFGREPLQGYALARRRGFFTDPRGGVYVLVRAFREKPDQQRREHPDDLIVRYEDDGTLASIAKLHGIPQGAFDPTLFAVQGNGEFLVTGLLGPRMGSLPAGPFTAIFDRSGQFVRQIELPNDVSSESELPSSEDVRSDSSSKANGSTQLAGKETGRTPNERPRTEAGSRSWTFAVARGQLVAAPDGNVYLLRASNPPRVYVISPTGEVVREFEIEASTIQGRDPVSMSLAGDRRLLLEFGNSFNGQPGSGDVANHLLVLTDTESGKVAGVFRMPQQQSGYLVPACATPRGEFLFIGASLDNHLRVAKFMAR